MKPIGTCKIHLLSEALSPITHMMGVSGNESILNREKIYHEKQVKEVPVLSGNALRHKMIREPGALYLVDILGLRGKLSIDQANYLFTGGSLTEGSISDNIGIIAEMQETFPLFRLLGGSLKNQVVGGSLFVSRGLLCCEENREIISKLAKIGIDHRFQPAQEFIGKIQYTRGDAAKMKDASEFIEDLKDYKATNLMIYSGQSIIPGSVFYHSLTLYNVSPLEVGAALHCISLWQNTGGIIGGSARIGHGKLKSSLWIDGLKDWFDQEKNPQDLIGDYVDYAKTNKDKSIAWLGKAFPGKKELFDDKKLESND